MKSFHFKNRYVLWEFVGTCDLGGGSEDDSEEPASKALVFMINFVNDRYKVPISHYFVDKLNGKGRLL